MKAIANINEFYSEHYMVSMLANDLKTSWVRMQEAADAANEGLSGQAAKARPVYEMLPRLKSQWEAAKNDASWSLWHHSLLTALGYQPTGVSIHVLPQGEKDEYTLPGLLNIGNSAGLRLCAFALPSTEADPLAIVESSTCKRWDKLLDELFSQELSPRWGLLLHGSTLLLLDRNKWYERRWLEFDFEQLYGLNDSAEWKMTAAILHSDSLCPDSNSCLLDDLEENSHKNAFAVSESLKDAIRESVELLGNEYVYYNRKAGNRVYEEDTALQAAELTRECVRFMYRLLFCFYLEARPELGFLPMGVDAYARGYSLERLREIEQTPLETEQEEAGLFFDYSLKQLFTLIWEGRSPSATQATLDEDFEIHPLRSHLFDPARTPRLSKVRFRNKCLQQIVRKLSLGSHGRGAGARSGRVSYATLGLNQLGAVYESLLSYSGFFAKAKLWEVKPADEVYNPAVHAYFVTEEELIDYTQGERAFDNHGAYITHEQGDFIYRLSGSDRKASASYYTPESLTRLTVKHALKELLPGKTADDILKLKVCEMAVGSASFLNEAINQLAEHYLRLKQAEVGRRIPQEEYKQELQRVKMYLADRNVTGVDLNATAVELAEVSLWLNSIYAGAFVPWFGNQLLHGNSLVGCKRHCWSAELVQRRTASDTKARWKGLSPTPYDWRYDVRPHGGIYHWLVPDEGMAPCKDKVLVSMHRAEVTHIKNWRKEFCKPFYKEEMPILWQLCEKADQLWKEHGAIMRACTAETTDPLTVWPEPMALARPKNTTAQKDDILARMMHNPASPHSRLKLAMDYWCALWFWPVEEARLLPSREDFQMDMAMILDIFNAMPSQPRLKQDLFEPDLFDAVEEEPKVELDFGDNGVDKLLAASPRLALVARIAREQAFFHWELECDNVFRERGGFDLIVGNPPWIKVEWEEGDLLGDYNPRFILRKIAADQLAALREQEFARRPSLKPRYIAKVTRYEGSQALLNALQLYPLLAGQQPNLYKNFVTRAWDISAPGGSIGFLHPDGIYDTAKGGLMRRALYPRLRAHYQFQNAFILFDIAHRAMFSINIYGSPRTEVGFDNISNIFSPRMVPECYSTSPSHLPAEGIKNAKGEWSVAGHPDRLVRVTGKTLELLARFYDEEGTPAAEARLPHIHTRGLLNIMEKMAAYPRPIAAIAENIYSAEMWHETGARKDGTIRRETCYPKEASKVILSGPHFYTSIPYYKTPRKICKEKGDYDIIDLETLPDDYLPRVNYVPACGWNEYVRRSPSLPWDSSKKYIDCNKLTFRRMIGTASERSMVPVLTCAGTAHVNTVRSLTTAHGVDTVAIACSVMSIIGDFYIKTTGTSDLYYQWMNLPLLPPVPAMMLRVLALNCLTRYYDELWQECWSVDFTRQHWYGDDQRLSRDFWNGLTKPWHRDCALRNAFARRWALCELDVLVARELGITVDELCEAYRIQFPVLKQNEDDTWYDVNGRIVFTCSKGLTGVGLSRKEFETIKHEKAGFTITKTWTDNNLPSGPVERTITYEAPFDRRDREADYRTIWEHLDREEAADP